MVRLPFSDKRRGEHAAPTAGRPAVRAADSPPAQESAPQEKTSLRQETTPAVPPADWAPLVIGDPIFDFEPKPPAPGACLADSVLDGWSTRHFTVRLASVRGYGHRYGGVSRQDDAIARHDRASGAVVIAVADGVSSAPQSHVGAAAACQAAVRAVLEALAARHGHVDWSLVIETVVERLQRCARKLLRDPGADLRATEESLATTLIVGYVLPDASGAIAEFVQVGDSGGWLLHRGRFYPVLAEKNQADQPILSSAVSPLPRFPGRLAPARFRLPPGSVLLIGTDGFGDPLGDGTGMVGQVFARHLRTPPPAPAFAHLLDFSRETFDDDRTLVAVWPQPPLPDPRR